jgi:hypothetical protein
MRNSQGNVILSQTTKKSDSFGDVDEEGITILKWLREKEIMLLIAQMTGNREQ